MEIFTPGNAMRSASVKSLTECTAGLRVTSTEGEVLTTAKPRTGFGPLRVLSHSSRTEGAPLIPMSSAPDSTPSLMATGLPMLE